MFIVRHGTILISKAVTGKVEQVLVRVEPSDFFGEMSLFDGSPRSATAQAETDVELLVLGRDSLQAMTETTPRAAATFFYAMVRSSWNDFGGPPSRWPRRPAGASKPPAST